MTWSSPENSQLAFCDISGWLREGGLVLPPPRPPHQTGDSAATARILSEGSRNGSFHLFPPLLFFGPLNIRCAVQWGREAVHVTSLGPGSGSSLALKTAAAGPKPRPLWKRACVVPERGERKLTRQLELLPVSSHSLSLSKTASSLFLFPLPFPKQIAVMKPDE